MTTNNFQQPPAPPLTITPDPITESHKHSPETTIHDQFTDNSYKINFRAHPCITIRRAAEGGQSGSNGRSRWVSC